MSIGSINKGGKGKGIIPHSRPSIDEEDALRAAEVIRSGMLTVGDERGAFERAFEKRIGISPEGAVSVDSGTAAIHLALLALKVGVNDRVILPAYLCAAPLNAVRYVGAAPVLADVDPDTGIAGEREFAEALESIKDERGGRTIIIAVHPFGRSAPVDEIKSLGPPVIEDCAQATGGALKGNPLGTFGDLSVFSFYATKVMTTGRGGMVCSESEEIAYRIRDLVRYDEREEDGVRFNYAMTEFQAALGRSQLKRLDAFISRRREITAYYSGEFERASIPMPRKAPVGDDINFRFIVKVRGAVDKVIKGLNKRGIGARRPVFKPLYEYTGDEELPGTKWAFDEDVSIPIYPALTDGEIEMIAWAVVDVMAEVRPSKV
ncbi:MAG: DegT/DnrJ/EryC1/StrS aminotransferase family protein [Deltaproteobacteria bacterium]|uniref:DegT/DnrJ/EryC1/StrS aminotransferase family protein n=1 Tax=Candidatus Zymogenus saltonus TaxID=2844893 RepID=A0A9D8PPN3_9DELT|nr:DegT/DnrJ/EryC1/StrS aminotransferase family protein [Candidatus Zymogenus saltonus]